MDLHLENKTAIITGSGSGLGLGIAKSLISEGANVIITDRNTERGLSALRELAGTNALYVEGDITSGEVIETCTSEAMNRFGSVDILIANVGSGKGSAGWNVPEGQWSEMLNLNFHGARRIVDTVVPRMISKKQGSIVFIGSIAGLEDVGAPMHYSVAKASLIAYSKLLSRRLANQGIRVNCVCPGNMYFEGGTWDIKSKEDPERVTRMLEEKVPQHRFATVAEVADLVTILVSDRSSFVTGACLVVDGGQTVSL